MDREKVIKGLENTASYFRHLQSVGFFGDQEIYYEYEKHCNDAIALMKEQETGHWIYLENGSNSGVYCSECHTKVFDNYPYKKKFSYFCPHCGTRMEGETERRRS